MGPKYGDVPALDLNGNKVILTELQTKMRCARIEAVDARCVANEALNAVLQAYYTTGREAAQAWASAAEDACKAKIDKMVALEFECLREFEESKVAYCATPRPATSMPTDAEYTESELAGMNIAANEEKAFGEATEPAATDVYLSDHVTVKLYEFELTEAPEKHETGEFGRETEMSPKGIKFQEKYEEKTALLQAAATTTAFNYDNVNATNKNGSDEESDEELSKIPGNLKSELSGDNADGEDKVKAEVGSLSCEKNDEVELGAPKLELSFAAKPLPPDKLMELKVNHEKKSPSVDDQPPECFVDLDHLGKADRRPPRRGFDVTHLRGEDHVVPDLVSRPR